QFGTLAHDHALHDHQRAARPGHGRADAVRPVERHAHHCGEPTERAFLGRRRAVACRRPRQWRGDCHRDFRHALLKTAMARAVLALIGWWLVAGPAAAQTIVTSSGPE